MHKFFLMHQERNKNTQEFHKRFDETIRSMYKYVGFRTPIKLIEKNLLVVA